MAVAIHATGSTANINATVSQCRTCWAAEYLAGIAVRFYFAAVALPLCFACAGLSTVQASRLALSCLQMDSAFARVRPVTCRRYTEPFVVLDLCTWCVRPESAEGFFFTSLSQWRSAGAGPELNAPSCTP